MTTNQIRRRYTRVVKIADKWNTYLQIDHQGFSVVEQTSYRRAQWFAKNLSIALDRIINKAKDGKRSMIIKRKTFPKWGN